MLTVTPNIRPYEPADCAGVLALLGKSSQQHTMLNWQQPARWLAKPHTIVTVGSAAQGIAAVMGLETDGSAEAWLRLMAVSSNISRYGTVRSLWAACQVDLQERGVQHVHFVGNNAGLFAALQNKQWQPTEQLITFRLPLAAKIDMLPNNPCATIRAAASADLPMVEAIDHLAFDPLWWFDQDTFIAALDEQLVFPIAEKDGAIVGYAIAMDVLSGGHLARIAVSPAAQGLGIGRQLVAAVVAHYHHGGGWLTLNTQASNTVSQHFYRGSGFEQAYYTVPVFTCAL